MGADGKTYPTAGDAIRNNSGGAEEVYILSADEALEDAPADAKIVIDPYASPAAIAAATPVVLRSSTPGSNKIFEITVDDSGKITATEVT